MKSIKNIGLENVQAVYGGPEGDLWELVMGEQIHIGGFQSSMDLAKRAGIGAGMQGIDLCCCNGAGMRFLVKFCNVSAMQGVDATPKVVTGNASNSSGKIMFAYLNEFADYHSRLEKLEGEAREENVESLKLGYICWRKAHSCSSMRHVHSKNR